jgi:hypothetical protein
MKKGPDPEPHPFPASVPSVPSVVNYPEATRLSNHSVL